MVVSPEETNIGRDAIGDVLLRTDADLVRVGPREVGSDGRVRAAPNPQEWHDFLRLGDSVAVQVLPCIDLFSQGKRISVVQVTSLQKVTITRPTALQDHSSWPNWNNETEAWLYR